MGPSAIKSGKAITYPYSQLGSTVSPVHKQARPITIGDRRRLNARICYEEESTAQKNGANAVPWGRDCR